MSDSCRKKLIRAVYPENPEISMADDPLHKDAANVIDLLRARIEELKMDCCVLDSIISHAAALLNDEMLSYQEASEKALDELNRVPQLKSDRLYVEIAEKDARIAELEALVNRVHDELHDPTGEYWCDCCDADQKLLESLRDHVDKVMGWGGER